METGWLSRGLCLRPTSVKPLLLVKNLHRVQFLVLHLTQARYFPVLILRGFFFQLMRAPVRMQWIVGRFLCCGLQAH